MDLRDRLTPALYTEFEGLDRARPVRPRQEQPPSRRRKREDAQEEDPNGAYPMREEWEEVEPGHDTSHEQDSSNQAPKRQRTSEQGYNYAQRLPARPPPPPAMAKVSKPVAPGPAAKAAGAAYYSVDDVRDAYDRLKYAIPTAEGYVGVGPDSGIDPGMLREFEPAFAREPPFDNERKMAVYDEVTKMARDNDKGPFSTQWFESDAAKRDALHAVPLYDSMLLLAAKFAAPQEDFFIQRPDMREFIHWVEDGMRDLEKERVMRRALSSDAQKIEKEVAAETRNFQLLFTDITTKALPSLASDGTGNEWETVRRQLNDIQTTPPDVIVNVLQSATTSVEQRKQDTIELAKYKQLLDPLTETGKPLLPLATSLLEKTNEIVSTMSRMVQFSETSTLFAYFNAPPEAKSKVTRWSPPRGLLRIDTKNMDLLRASANWKPILAPLGEMLDVRTAAFYQYSNAEVDQLLANLFSLASANGFGEVGTEDGLELTPDSSIVLGQVLHLNRRGADAEASRLFISLANAISPTRKLQEAAGACVNLMRALLGVPLPAPVPVAGAAAAVVAPAPAAPPESGGVAALARRMWKSLALALARAVPAAAPGPVVAPAPAPAAVPPPAAAPAAGPVPPDPVADATVEKFASFADILPGDLVSFLKIGIEIEQSLRKLWELNIPWAVDARLLAVREFFSYEYVRATLLALVTVEIQEKKEAAQQRRDRIKADMENLASTDFIGRILSQQELRRKFMRMYWHSRQPHLQPTFAISGRARVIIDAAEEAIRRFGGDWVYFDSGPVLVQFWIDKKDPQVPPVPQACSFREVFLSFMHFMEREREPLNGIVRRSAYESRAMVVREMNEKAKLARYSPRSREQADKFPPYHPLTDRNMNFHPDNM